MGKASMREPKSNITR